MSEYRKKPVVIEAVKWTGDNLREIIDFTGLHPSANKWTWDEYAAVVREDGLKIFTLEGSHMATVGDMIIKGVQGEFYPCKPDIFAATYDQATESAGREVTADRNESAAAQEHNAQKMSERAVSAPAVDLPTPRLYEQCKTNDPTRCYSDRVLIAMREYEADARELWAALSQCDDYFAERCDVTDGEDGRPRANESMSMQQEIAPALEKHRAKYGPAPEGSK